MKLPGNDFRSGLARGMGLGVGLLFVFAVTALVAQTIRTFNAGELISAASINANFSNLKSEISEAVPDGAVMAFHLTACPPGWVPADGDVITLDLRGQFLRGMNDFGSAAGARADGKQDPNGTGRTPGDEQDDSLVNHTHSYFGNEHGFGDVGNGTWARGLDTGPLFVRTTGGAGGSETRPKNVALLFCMRQNN